MAQNTFLGSLSKQDRESLIRRLHALQQGRCYISNEPIDLQVHEVDLDHIKARARGGADDESNIALALAHHNRSKGVRDLELQRRLYRFYQDLQAAATGANAGVLTVGDVLAKIRGECRAVSLTWATDTSVRVAWTSTAGEPCTREFTVLVDQSADDTVRRSFFGRLPAEIVDHSTLNPRSIHDLEPMIEEFYYQHPQMQPSLAFFDPTSASQTTGRFMLFDGQHKAAAQLYNASDALLCRVFLPAADGGPDGHRRMVDELRRTNFRAHTKLAQLHFAQATEDKVGHTLYVDTRDEIVHMLTKRGVDAKEISEQSVARAVRDVNPEEAKEFKAQHASFLRYEILTSRDLELLKFVETVSARSRRYPISYDTLKKFLDVFLYSDLAKEPIADTDAWRLKERENLARLMDLLAEEALSGKFKLEIGVYKLDEKIDSNPQAVPLDHLRAYRLFRKPALSVWADVLRDVISQYLVARDKYAKGWHKDRPLWANIEGKEWDAIRRGIKAIVGHKVWAETQKHLLGSLASTRKRDWDAILLEGKLPGRAEKLYSEMSVSAIFKAVTQD